MTLYTYKALLEDQGLKDAGRADCRRDVQFQISSPYDHFNVSDNDVLDRIERACRRAISRRCRPGETCLHYRIVDPEDPRAAARRAAAGRSA